MKHHALLLSALVLGASTLMTGCDAPQVTAQLDGQDHALLHGMATKSYTLQVKGLPPAELTPDGNLVIDGKPVTLTAEQKALVMDYRAHLQLIAQDGINVGREGANLGISAAMTAIGGVLSGKPSKEIKDTVEAKTGPILEAAAQLCSRLPQMQALQQALAASIPEFAPYSGHIDIDECSQDFISRVD